MEKSLILLNLIAAIHQYEVSPGTNRRGFDLISEALPFGRLCSEERTPQSITQSFTAVHMTL